MSEGICILVAFVLGWALAQLIKCSILIVKMDEFNPKLVKKTILKSGGMPSGHTASLTAVTMFLLLSQGISVNFAMMCCLLALFAYDAVNVRYAVGEQGRMLNKLLHRRMRVVEGHTVFQVIIGILLGLVVGALVFLIYKLSNGGF